jgi:bacillithiol system protein YtxJ
MENHFVRMNEPGRFEELLQRSYEQPVIIFKHSLSCSTSSVAYKEMAGLPGEVVLVEVQNAPELSQKIEKLTAVRHESPQVIVLRKGKAVWSASHWRVKAEAVAAALSANA